MTACFAANAFGEDLSCDSSYQVTTAQLYELASGASEYELRFNAEECSQQSHDGTLVYESKRVVEYKISRSNDKIAIKRRVVSTDKSAPCEDEAVKALFPDVTLQLLSSVLASGKIKTEKQKQLNVKSHLSEQADEHTLLIDKLAARPLADDTAMGETMRYETFTEELIYASKTTNSLDQLKAIKSKMKVSLTDKAAANHTIQVTETITLQLL